MNIAIAQFNTHAGDFNSTADRMRAASQMVQAADVRLLVASMAAFCGPLPVDYPNREGYAIDLATTLEDLASDMPCACLVPVMSEMDGEPFNEVMLLHNGEVTPLRMDAYMRDLGQRHSANSGSDPARSSSAMPPLTTFELEGLTFGLALTYEDLDDLVMADVRLDVVIFISDYAYALDDSSSVLGAALDENRFRSDAVALDAWLVGVGSFGGYDLQVYTGSSFVLSPRGELMASAPAFEEALLTASVGNASNGDAGELAGVPLEAEIYNRSLHLWEALSLGLADFVRKQSRDDVVLVLDGGLASCLLATLASDALGPMHVHVLIPSGISGVRAKVARLTADALRVHVLPAHQGAFSSAQPADDERLQADIEQAYLAYAARTYGAVPLSGEDKTFLALEASEGICHAAELLPFGDVYRSDLVELAHMRRTISPVIPPEAFALYEAPDIEEVTMAETTPEACLKRMDVVLSMHIEWERSLSDVAARQGEAVVCERILKRLWERSTSRASWPPYLVASSRPLFVARMPFNYAWCDVVRDDEARLMGRSVSDRVFLANKSQGRGSETAPSSIAELLEGLEVDTQARSPQMEGALEELIGLLQDLIQTGGDQPPTIEGPFGPLTWGSPFSEN